MTKANFFSYAALTAALFAAAACKPPHDSAYFNKGTPESLLDVSSEVVNQRRRPAGIKAAFLLGSRRSPYPRRTLLQRRRYSLQ